MSFFQHGPSRFEEAGRQHENDPVHLAIRNLHKSYDDHHVLKGMTFDIYRRQVNLIIGPSGSGKTVLMRQIVRLEQPDEGEILLDGIDIARVKDRELTQLRRRFGMVFQMNALFDSMNVYDNVAFPLREHTKLKNSEIRERVMDRLGQLGVGNASKKMPSELSGGMQKRVAVARALVLETAVLIYDEPTTGLDPITSRTVDDLIVETGERFGVTSIVISHDMASVFQIADYITYLYFGRIMASGTPETFVASTDDETRRFLMASGVSADILQGKR